MGVPPHDWRMQDLPAPHSELVRQIWMLKRPPLQVVAHIVSPEESDLATKQQICPEAQSLASSQWSELSAHLVALVTQLCEVALAAQQ
jgi:hypothetical protein